MHTAIHIRDARLVDGTGAAAVAGTDVVVNGDEIAEIGPTGTLAVPPDAIVVEAAGGTVMPGLIDAHCHVTFDDVQSNDELFFHRPAPLAALAAAFNLRKLLLAGVTSFFDPDTVHGIGPQLRDAIEAGLCDGPRMATGVQALLTSVGGT